MGSEKEAAAWPWMEERLKKCASKNINMKMCCDSQSELFSLTLMPTATLLLFHRLRQPRFPLPAPCSGGVSGDCSIKRQDLYLHLLMSL